MVNLSKILEQKIEKVVGEEFELEQINVTVQKPTDTRFGDLSSNIALKLSKELKKNPVEIAEIIIDKLVDIDGVKSVKVVRPGFINFVISKSEFVQKIGEGFEIALKEEDRFGDGLNLEGKRIMVEYAHPNPFKVVHIGHLRNIILGESIIRLLESQGAEVIRTNYQGDVGMHIAKSIWAWLKVDPKDYPKDVDERVNFLGRCYSKGATAYKEDDEAKEEIIKINKRVYTQVDEEVNKLWEMGKKWSFDSFHKLAKRVYSTFDKEYMESEVMGLGVEKVKEAVEKGILKKDEGAVIFDGEEYGLHTRVFLNSEGLPTYEGKELGLGYKEFTDFGELDLCIHNVAVEQISFFKVAFKVQELLDPELFKGKQYHNAYELVDLKGEKMSSRLGNIIGADELLDLSIKELEGIVEEKGIELDQESLERLCVATVKYSFLKVSPFKKLIYSVEDSISFDGNSGPYIEYTYARANSVLQKYDGNIEEVLDMVDYKEVAESLVEDDLGEFAELFLEFPKVVKQSTNKYSPHFISTYLYELCQGFNKFYNKHSILNASSLDKIKSRVILTKLTTVVIRKGLFLLGAKVVDRM